MHASIIISNGQEPDYAVASKLISLYSQFNDFGSSVDVLKGMKESNTFIWNSVIKAGVNLGLHDSAFAVYKLMRENGVQCDGYTFPILSKLVVLFECGVSFAEMIHCLGLRMGFESDVYFCNAIIGAYVKSGCCGNALKVFDEMPDRDLVSWTSMISGCAYEGDTEGAFGLFNQMREEVEPNEVTMIVMLQTCSHVAEGGQFHGCAIKYGSMKDRSLENSILKMYTDFGCADDSEALFAETELRDVVSWNIMINLYSSEGNTVKMVDCLNIMRAEVEPNSETFTLLISGLGERPDHGQCRQIHCLALKSGSLDDILMTSLFELYTKSADLDNSTKLFQEFSQMNYTTENMSTLVVAFTHVGALRSGKAVHGYLVRNLVSFSERARSLETSILNMYVRCGDISSARICFDRMLVKDLITWSSMIEGYGTHGLASEALNIFDQMKAEGITPNGVTFLSLLSACSHSGLVLEGYKALLSMKWEFSIEPELDHYTCVVDLLGRSGKIKEALSIILKLVVSPDCRIWAALLASAKVHEERKVAEYAMKQVSEMENDNAGYLTLFSNVEASLENWSGVEKVRRVMKEMNLVKYPGWSCLEVKGAFHGFVSGDRSHDEIHGIYTMIEYLRRNAIDVGKAV